MSNQLGMDIALVRAQAGQLDGVAHDLDNLAESVNACVNHLAQHWLGEDAHQLAQHWNYRDRAAVNALAEEIRGLAVTVRANAEQQEQTSAALTASVIHAGAGGTGAAAAVVANVPGGGGGVRDGLDSFESRLSALTGFLGTSALLGRLHKMTGPIETPQGLLSTWRRVASASTTARTHLLSATGLSRIHVSSSVLKDAGATIHGSVTALGIAGAAVTAVAKTVDAVDDFGHGRAGDGLRDIADGAAPGLKASPNPYVQVAGVALSEVSDISEMASKIDIHQPMPSLTASNLTHIYGPAVADAFIQLPSHVWKWLS